jgi:diguanylate cyclase (GGDEF)-like protein
MKKSTAPDGGAGGTFGSPAPAAAAGHLAQLAALSAALCALYAAVLADTAPFVFLRLKVLDGLYRGRHAAIGRAAEAPPIVIAAIDDASLRELGERWPWKRGIYAEFLDRTAALGASVTAFDLSFSVPSEDDPLFAEALRRNGRSVLGAYYGEGAAAVGPAAPLAAAASGVGFLDAPRDPDNTHRRIELLRGPAAEGPARAFSLETAALHAGEDPRALYARWSGDTAAHPAPRAFFAVYDYRPEDLVRVPFWRFLRPEGAEPDVRGKIVLVGATGEIFHDIYQTPLGALPGVYVHANQVAAMLEDRRLRAPSVRVFYAALVLAAFGVMALFQKARPVPALALAGLGALGAWLLAQRLFLGGVALDLFSALFILAASAAAGLGVRSLRLLVENQRLRYQSSRDGLTDLYTYRFMESRLMAEFDRARKNGEVLSFIIFDLDHFKRLNDVYGHERGNEILVAFARILKLNTRGGDLVARYGGEEFCMLLPRQDGTEARGVAERIRRSLEETPFRFARKGESSPSDITVTVSAGIATSQTAEIYNGKELLRVADAALLRAKESGRNRICVHGEIV